MKVIFASRSASVITACLASCVVFAAVAVGCSSDDKAACEAIVEACHPVDPGAGAIHECHENAESKWSKDQCVAMSADCLRLCQASDGGARD